MTKGVPTEIASGQRFGRYTVIQEADRQRKKNGASVRMILARCDCGTEKTVRLDCLRSGTTVSCGCFHSDQARDQGHAKKTHGKAKTHLYMVWSAMKQRCHNPRNKSYWRYGARGISVCDEWFNSFEAFSQYVGVRPEGQTIDRIDSSGNYEPGNVRWATYIEQARNTRRNIFVLADGKEMTLPEACELFSFNYETARKSIRKYGQFQGVIHVR